MEGRSSCCRAGASTWIRRISCCSAPTLVTDPAAIHLAYNDPQGVTAAFNRNLLRNVNSFVPEQLRSVEVRPPCPYVVEKRRIEMWLVAREPMEIDLGRLGSRLKLAPGEGIRTEISRRFMRDEVLRLVDGAGFNPERWIESPDGRFGLALGLARVFAPGVVRARARRQSAPGVRTSRNAPSTPAGVVLSLAGFKAVYVRTTTPIPVARENIQSAPRPRRGREGIAERSAVGETGHGQLQIRRDRRWHPGSAARPGPATRSRRPALLAAPASPTNQS